MQVAKRREPLEAPGFSRGERSPCGILDSSISTQQPAPRRQATGRKLRQYTAGGRKRAPPVSAACCLPSKHNGDRPMKILTSLHGRLVGLDARKRLIAPAGIIAGVHDVVTDFDDFLGDLIADEWG